MQPEKVTQLNEVVERFEKSPFLFLADFTGLTVKGFSELRKRLSEVGADLRVVKNSQIKKAAEKLGLPEDIRAALVGQTATVTGSDDVSAAAKVLKKFADEFSKAKVKLGVVEGLLLQEEAVKALASLPSKDALRSQLLGVLLAPGSKLVRTLNEPAASLARLLQAKNDKENAA